MPNTVNAAALVELLAKALTDAPDQVVVEPETDGDTEVLNLTVAEQDMGRVIGKNGRTARALRSIVHAASIKAHRRLELEILD